MMGAAFHGVWHGRHRDRPVHVSKALGFRILAYLRPYWRQVGATVVLLTAIATIGLVPPLLIRTVVDVALPSGDALLLALLAGGMVAAPALSGLLGVAQAYFNAQISQQVMFDLRNDLYRHVQSLSLRFFTATKTGEIMSRLNNDVSGISRVVGETLTQNLQQVFVLTTTVAVMVQMEWRLALLALLVVPLVLPTTRRVGLRRFNLQHELHQKQAEMSALMQETLNISGYLLMKAFGRDSFEQGRFRKTNEELRNMQISASMLGRWFRALLQVVEALGPALIFLVGGLLVIQAELTLGTIIAFIALLNRLYGPISQLANVHVELMGVLALFERIFEYLDFEPEIKDAPGARPLARPVRGQIAFRDVSFEYVPGRAIVDTVSFDVQPGQLVALVGPSGAGKTTITYLIPRFYDVTRGTIEVDGQDVRRVTLGSLRDAIGMVTQETYLFNATVRENLRYARSDATDDEIDAACRAARLREVIDQLPAGYDTEVGERGYRLSGGEKQRMAIARVLLKDPPILMLDEATSSLDSETEQQIQAALGPLLHGRTTIAIAHRLSTVLAADKLLVLHNGRLVEQGTHRELLARGGLYARLFEIQFKPQLMRESAAPLVGLAGA